MQRLEKKGEKPWCLDVGHPQPGCGGKRFSQGPTVPGDSSSWGAHRWGVLKHPP